MNFFLLPLFLLPVAAQIAPETRTVEAVCTDASVIDRCMEAAMELKDLHDSSAEIEFHDPVIIVHDWDGRIYVDGGDQKPMRATLTIGHFVERELEMTLPISVQYREEPPEPMFRLRFRAQAGILVPEVIKVFDGQATRTFDAQLGLDWFHLGPFNTSVNLGVVSCGAGFGMDLTKNFGLMAGYAFIYSKLQSGAITGIYFSFN
jgi:hypothetical protein